MSNTRERTPILAVFCDFENIALGVRDAKYKRFDIRRVLERLLLKGSIVVKKAYCDWDRYKAFKPPMHEAAFELIEIPHLRQSGKNSADIRMVVDALDLCYTKSHVNTFVIISGDSDFSPLVSKLRENDKAVIGVGVANSSSDLLIANCDEFIYYDDLVRTEAAKKPPARGRGKQSTAPDDAAPMDADASGGTSVADEQPPAAVDGEEADADTAKPKRRSSRRGTRGGKSRTARTDAAADAEAPIPTPALPAEPAPEVEELAGESDKATKGLALVCDTVAALAEELGEEQKIWGSMVKQTLRRRRPGFNESFHGFRSFNAMLEEAQHRGLLALEKDEKSGGYIVHQPEGAPRLHLPDDQDSGTVLDLDTSLDPARESDEDLNEPNFNR